MKLPRLCSDIIPPDLIKSSLPDKIAGQALLSAFFVEPFFIGEMGVLAQLVERLNGIEEVTGSNPVGSSPERFRDCLAVAHGSELLQSLQPWGFCDVKSSE